MKWKILFYISILILLVIPFISAPTFTKKTVNFVTYTNSSIFGNGTLANASIPTIKTFGQGINLTTQNYTNAATVDNVNASVSANGNNLAPFLLFNITINVPASSIQWLSPTIRAGEGAVENGYAYIYNYTLGNWTPLGQISTTIGNISNNYTAAAAISGVISPNNQINLLVVGDSFDAADAGNLRVDYVEAVVGYTDNESRWFSNTTNGTTNGTYILHSVNWTGDFDLSGYIFEFNNGTSYANDTFVTFTGTANWSNVSKWVSTTVGTNISWRVYVNDSLNQFNSTSLFNYTLTSPPSNTCTYTSGNWNINCADFCNITSNTNGGGNNITFGGTGSVDLEANLTNFLYLIKDNACSLIKSNPSYIQLG